jgi:hypothetical protein
MADWGFPGTEDGICESISGFTVPSEYDGEGFRFLESG